MPKLFDGTLTLPVDHPKLPRCLRINQASPKHYQQLSAGLIDLTRSNLAYAEHQPAGSVLRALEKGYGECVDFADLLTTLARSQKIPTRTVTASPTAHCQRRVSLSCVE